MREIRNQPPKSTLFTTPVFSFTSLDILRLCEQYGTERPDYFESTQCSTRIPARGARKPDMDGRTPEMDGWGR